MLLIRPLLQTNRERRHVAHTVVFFIFLVSNHRRLSDPARRPALFLGYLLGCRSHWTFRLTVPWLFTVAAGPRHLRDLDRRPRARGRPRPEA